MPCFLQFLRAFLTIKSKLQQHSKIDSISGVKSYAFDESMDAAFKEEYINGDFASIRDETQVALRSLSTVSDRALYESEDFILQKAFEKIEGRFQYTYERKEVSVANNWIESIFGDMVDGLFDYTFNHGLSHFYDQKILRETTETAQDNAFDKIFNCLIFDEEYFPENTGCFQTRLTSVYGNIFKEEFQRLSSDNGFAKLVESFLEEKWIRKFNKFGLDYELNENK